MDINELLRQIRDAIVDVNAALAFLADHELDDRAGLADPAGELATKVADLDAWITGGGFLPEEWARAVRNAGRG